MNISRLNDVFQKVRLLDKGAFTETYLGKDNKLGSQVVIAKLQHKYAADREAARHFVKEVPALLDRLEQAQCSTTRFAKVPRLLKVCIDSDSTPCLVFEHQDGAKLSELAGRPGTLSAHQLWSVVQQLATTVARLHLLGVSYVGLSMDRVVVAGGRGLDITVAIIYLTETLLRALLPSCGLSVEELLPRHEDQAPEVSTGFASPQSDVYELGSMIAKLLPMESSTQGSRPRPVAHERSLLHAMRAEGPGDRPVDPKLRDEVSAVLRALGPLEIGALVDGAGPEQLYDAYHVEQQVAGRARIFCGPVDKPELNQQRLQSLQALSSLRPELVEPIVDYGELASRAIYSFYLPDHPEVRPLDRWLQSHTKLELGQILDLGVAIASCAEEVQKLGLVMRTPAPCTLGMQQLDSGLRVRLLDTMGVTQTGRPVSSRALHEQWLRSQPHQVRGFLAPELIDGSAACTSAGDVFGIAAILAYALTTRLPYPEDSDRLDELIATLQIKSEQDGDLLLELRALLIRGLQRSISQRITLNEFQVQIQWLAGVHRLWSGSGELPGQYQADPDADLHLDDTAATIRWKSPRRGEKHLVKLPRPGSIGHEHVDALRLCDTQPDPYIARVWAHGQACGINYVVLAPQPGQTLAERRTRTQLCLSNDEAVPVARQLCKVLAWLHAQGQRHRSVNAHTIVLAKPEGSTEYVVSLIHLGLTPVPIAVTKASPQASVHEAVVDSPSSDVYTAAATVCTVLGCSTDEKAIAKLPRGRLATQLARMLAPTPESRPTAAAVVVALQPTQRLEHRSRWRTWSLTTLALATLVTLGGLGRLAYRSYAYIEISVDSEPQGAVVTDVEQNDRPLGHTPFRRLVQRSELERGKSIGLFRGGYQPEFDVPLTLRRSSVAITLKRARWRIDSAPHGAEVLLSATGNRVGKTPLEVDALPLDGRQQSVKLILALPNYVRCDVQVDNTKNANIYRPLQPAVPKAPTREEPKVALAPQAPQTSGTLGPGIAVIQPKNELVDKEFEVARQKADKEVRYNMIESTLQQEKDPLDTRPIQRLVATVPTVVQFRLKEPACHLLRTARSYQSRSCEQMERSFAQTIIDKWSLLTKICPTEAITGETLGRYLECQRPLPKLYTSLNSK